MEGAGVLVTEMSFLARSQGWPHFTAAKHVFLRGDFTSNVVLFPLGSDSTRAL